MNGVFLETNRLILRRLTEADFSALHGVLSKESVMYAWEHGFSREESADFLQRMMRRYETDGYAYFAAIEKESGAFLGVIGLLAEEIAGEACTGVGYILDDRFWGKGYAAEGAQACLDYAFSVLHAPRVIADIRPENTASRRVAARLGMQEEGVFDKFYYGKHMPHIIYAAYPPDSHDAAQAAFWTAIDRLVKQSELIIDRPKGSAHPRYPSLIYPVDYGYLKDTSSMDGGGIDVWIGTNGEKAVDAIICTVDLMKRDSEIKILIGCTEEEKRRILRLHNETACMKGVMLRRNPERNDL